MPTFDLGLGIDLSMAVGIGFVVRQLVVYLKPVWSKVDNALRPLINALVCFFFGILLSFAVLGYQKQVEGVKYILSLGVLSGVVAILYNDHRTKLDDPNTEGKGVTAIINKVKDLK